MTRSVRRVNVEMLVGLIEAAQIIGLTDSRVLQLVRSDPTFPQPVHRVRATQLWLAPELEHWVQTRVKGKPGAKKGSRKVDKPET